MVLIHFGQDWEVPDGKVLKNFIKVRVLRAVFVYFMILLLGRRGPIRKVRWVRWAVNCSCLQREASFAGANLSRVDFSGKLAHPLWTCLVTLLLTGKRLSPLEN